MDKRKRIMWLGVLIVSVIIFFAWIFFLKSSLSRQLEIKSGKEESGGWEEVKVETSKLWENFSGEIPKVKENVENLFREAEAREVRDRLKDNVIKEIGDNKDTKQDKNID